MVQVVMKSKRTVPDYRREVVRYSGNVFPLYVPC